MARTAERNPLEHPLYRTLAANSRVFKNVQGLTESQQKAIARTLTKGLDIRPEQLSEGRLDRKLATLMEKRTTLAERIDRCSRLIEMNAQFLADEQFESLLEKVSKVRMVVSASLRSSDPSKYMSFLLRMRKDPLEFVEHAQFFAGNRMSRTMTFDEETIDAGKRFVELLKAAGPGRKEEIRNFVQFVQGFLAKKHGDANNLKFGQYAAELLVQVWSYVIPEEGQRIMRTFSKKFLLELFREHGIRENGIYTVSDIRGMLKLLFQRPDFESMWKYLPDFGVGLVYMRTVYGNKAMLPVSLYGVTNIKDMRLCFSRDKPVSKYLGVSGFNLNHGKDSVIFTHYRGWRYVLIHETQHAFDRMIGIRSSSALHEYRADLAALYSSKDCMCSYMLTLLSADIKLRKAMLYESEEENHNENFERMKRSPHMRASRRIKRELAQEYKEGRDLREKAMELLNAAYKRACGLSYDQILEPFKK